MDNTNKKEPMMISLVLISLAIVGRLPLLYISLTLEDTTAKLLNALTILALIVAFIYVFTEFKKSSSKYFKLFIISYAIMMLGYMLDKILASMTADIILELLVLALLIVLLAVKNLGKNKSTLISFAILTMELISTIAMCVATSEIPQATVLIIALSRLTLAVVLVIMMFLKYSDKQLRGTK